MWSDDEQREADVEAAHRALVAGGRLEPLALGSRDERAWSECDLASMAEHRLGDRTDPRALDAARRADWIARATTDGLSAPSDRIDWEACFWLLEAGARAGTIAIARSTVGSRLLHVASLYVYPDRRGRGVGRRALTSLRAQLAPGGLGVRLDTSWTWPRTVGFYLRLGMGVQSWRRELTLEWEADAPPAAVLTEEARRATLSVDLDGERHVLAAASRDGACLTLHELDRATHPRVERLRSEAQSTFVLQLAMRGWPLVRSEERWARSSGADLGAPEGLASKIELWEAWSREQGWRVETPRIPGLEYPDWVTLKARWAQEEAQRRASV